jgi:hypothetical protein
MSLSSGFSDIHWDRINARVEHLLEVISSSPTLHKRINSADFVDMGAHFYVFPQNSWPKQIDTVHDNTTCTQAYHEANMTKDSKTPSLPTLPGHGTGSGALPPTPILTATQRAPYLLAEEFTGLMINRQRDEQRKHREGTYPPGVAIEPWLSYLLGFTQLPDSLHPIVTCQDGGEQDSTH